MNRFITVLLLLMSGCNEVKTIKNSECIDGVEYEVLEYGKFLRFENGKVIECKL